MVLGVKKYLDGSFDLLGTDKEIDDADLQGVASSLLEPSPRFNYQVIPYCGVHLGLITIYRGQRYPSQPRRTLDDGFVGGRIYFRRGSQNTAASTYEQRMIWDWFRGQDNSTAFQGLVGDKATFTGKCLNAEALLLGPVEALGLTSRAKEAEQLESNAPADAAEIYEEIARTLRERFPGHADRFDQRRATALRAAGNLDASHDILMKLAIRDLWERAEPKLTPSVMNGFKELHSKVNKIRQVRGSALVHFGKCHENSGELEKLAECFDGLGVDDEFSPVIATLFAEAALADRAFQVVLDRNESLQSAAADGDSKTKVRLHAALGDAGVAGFWPTLIKKAESLRFPPAEGAYLCIRGARWCAWNGQVEKAESLYRLAMKLGSEADLDLDVENALWSLNVLYSFTYPFDGLNETNLMARSMGGSQSYVRLNARTQQRSYQYLANRRLPDAHLWAQYRLLESIRSGCLMAELESHMILARIYAESDETLDALEHAVLGGSQQLVKESAPKVKVWPEFLADMVTSKAPWVCQNALLALEYVGDLAPPELARSLVTELLRQLREDTADVQIAPTLLKALSTIILEATDKDISKLIPVLERAAVRQREEYLLTDPGVMTLAARLYRFRA